MERGRVSERGRALAFLVRSISSELLLDDVTIGVRPFEQRTSLTAFPVHISAGNANILSKQTRSALTSTTATLVGASQLISFCRYRNSAA